MSTLGTQDKSCTDDTSLHPVMGTLAGYPGALVAEINAASTVMGRHFGS